MRPSDNELAGYVARNLSERDIGRLCGVNRNVVHAWLYYQRKPRLLPPVGTIAAGLTLGLSERQIAGLLGVPRSTIQGMRRKAGLPNTSPGRRPRRIKVGAGESKPHRPGDQPTAVHLIDDESIWFRILCGKQYQDAVTDDGGIFRMARPSRSSGNSSMAWAG